jgi:hypothetical protein
LIKVSYSMISCYLDCAYKHYLRYIQRLRPKKPERSLFFGKDFHKLLQFRHNKTLRIQAFKEIQQTYNDMPRIFQPELGDNYLEELKTIFSDYKKTWKDSEKPIETEHEFLLPIAKYKGEEVCFHGIIDEVYEDLVMGEHKTFSTAPGMDTLAMNMQVCLYAKAWELETGQKFVRVMWDYTKSKSSVYPIWLESSGRFSTAKNNNITPYSWIRACNARGITDLSILSQGDMYKPNISNFFFRCYIELLPQMVDSVWEDFQYTVKDVIKRGGSNKTKNIGRQCNWCGFRPICYAEFTGTDVTYILERDFEIKKEEAKQDEGITG